MRSAKRTKPISDRYPAGYRLSAEDGIDPAIDAVIVYDGPPVETISATAGVCTQCKKPVDTDTGWCRACLDAENQRRAAITATRGHGTRSDYPCAGCGRRYPEHDLDDLTGRCVACRTSRKAKT